VASGVHPQAQHGGDDTDGWEAIRDDCVHAIDTVRWMCGGQVVEIESRCKRIGTPDINWIGATLHFDNGPTARWSGTHPPP
jgi:predicted dehydrogenase